MAKQKRKDSLYTRLPVKKTILNFYCEELPIFNNVVNGYLSHFPFISLVH